MARDVTYDVIARDKSDAGLKSVEQGLSRTSKEVGKLQQQFSRAFGQWQRGFSTLTRAADKWSKSGNSSSQKFVRGLGAGLGALGKAGGAIASGLSKAVNAAGPQVTLALTGVLAAAAAAAAPGIAGALVGSAALGGIVGGVLIAARDVRVASAFEVLKEDIGDQLGDAAQAFVPATLAAVDDARVAFQGLLPDLRRLFDTSAGYLSPLVRSLGQSAKLAMSGITQAVENAGPVVYAIGRGIEDIGASVGKVFADLSDNGNAMAAGLSAMFKIITVSLEIFGRFLNGVTESFEIFVTKIPGGKRWLESFSKSSDSAADSTNGLAMGFEALADDADAAAKGLSRVKQQADELVDNTLSLRDAQIQSREAMLSATKAIRENGAATGFNTEKGRENEKALNDLARAFNEETDAAARSGVATSEASKRYQANRQALINQAVAAGYSRSEAEKLTSQLLKVPAQTNTDVKLTGAQAALNAIQNLRAEASRFSGTYTATMVTNYVTYGKPRSTHPTANTYAGMAARPSWQDSQPGAVSRSGGPVPVNVTNTILLDGAPFRSYTNQAVTEANNRREWRNRLGRR